MESSSKTRLLDKYSSAVLVSERSELRSLESDFMKVLDLFCGLKGWTSAFEERGHEVITVDIEGKFNPTITKDIMLCTIEDFKQYLPFDLVLASPPCNCFSVASIYRHWKDGQPKDEQTRQSIRLVQHTFDLIKEINPKWWLVENPRGMLRTVIGKPNYEITQCQYGRSIMKPTDLWGKLPASFIPKRCKNGASCHERASRGSRKGVQGINNSFSNLGSKGKELRAKIPYGLSLEVCKYCEGDENE